MEITNIFTDFDSLNRNLVFEVITLIDKRHIQYGDYTYRHAGDRVLKEGVKKSYWSCIKKQCHARVHTLGPVAVRVVNLHTCTIQKFNTEEKVSMDHKLDLPVLDDLSDCLSDINKSSLLNTKDDNLLHTQSLLRLLNEFHSLYDSSLWKH